MAVPSLRTRCAVLPRRALQSVVSSSGLARRLMGLVHREQPKISEESIRPCGVIAEASSFRCDTLSIKLCHLPPFTPHLRAANIASVQIGAGATFCCSQLPSALASRLVVSDTGDASTLISASLRSSAINLPALTSLMRLLL